MIQSMGAMCMERVVQKVMDFLFYKDKMFGMIAVGLHTCKRFTWYSAKRISGAWIRSGALKCMVDEIDPSKVSKGDYINNSREWDGDGGLIPNIKRV